MDQRSLLVLPSSGQSCRWEKVRWASCLAIYGTGVVRVNVATLKGVAFGISRTITKRLDLTSGSSLGFRLRPHNRRDLNPSRSPKWDQKKACVPSVDPPGLSSAMTAAWTSPVSGNAGPQTEHQPPRSLSQHHLQRLRRVRQLTFRPWQRPRRSDMGHGCTTTTLFLNPTPLPTPSTIPRPGTRSGRQPARRCSHFCSCPRFPRRRFLQQHHGRGPNR